MPDFFEILVEQKTYTDNVLNAVDTSLQDFRVLLNTSMETIQCLRSMRV